MENFEIKDGVAIIPEGTEHIGKLFHLPVILNLTTNKKNLNLTLNDGQRTR